jgi:hypothetical protein
MCPPAADPAAQKSVTAAVAEITPAIDRFDTLPILTLHVDERSDAPSWTYMCSLPGTIPAGLLEGVGQSGCGKNASVDRLSV